MNESQLLPPDLYAQVTRDAPVVSIDLLMYDSSGRLLVGRRVNNPAKNFFFVPGGRVLKDESINNAIIRICANELGILFERQQMEFVGVHEHRYPNNFLNEEWGTHYICFGFKKVVDNFDKTNINSVGRMQSQHDDVVWMTQDEILYRDDVHEFIKCYTKEDPFNRII